MTSLRIRTGIILFAILLATPACAQPDFEEIDAAIAAGEFTNALRLIDAGLDDHRGNPGLRLKRAQILSYSGRQATALRELDRLRSDYPRDVDYILARAACSGTWTAIRKHLRSCD